MQNTIALHFAAISGSFTQQIAGTMDFLKCIFYSWTVCVNFKHEKVQLACNRYIQVITGHRIYCQICDDFCQNLHLNYWYTQGHWCTPTRLFQLQDVKCVLCPHLLCHIILLLWLKFSGQMCDFLVMLNCHILKISNVTMIMVVQCLEN